VRLATRAVTVSSAELALARRERSEVAARLEAEGGRLSFGEWYSLRPLLGAGSSRLERHLLGRALERAGSMDDLPLLLRAALALQASTDAVTMFGRVAVVLPADASLDPEPMAEQAGSRWRRSERPPYRNVLAAIRNGSWLGLSVDLAFSDGLADRLLAHQILYLPNAIARHAAISAMGVPRFMAAARLRPVKTDAAGELYLVGPASDPLAFVRVLDATAEPGGEPNVHWLSVPPHVATAREAVAWTFGLGEQECAPATENLAATRKAGTTETAAANAVWWRQHRAPFPLGYHVQLIAPARSRRWSPEQAASQGGYQPFSRCTYCSSGAAFAPDLPVLAIVSRARSRASLASQRSAAAWHWRGATGRPLPVGRRHRGFGRFSRLGESGFAVPSGLSCDQSDQSDQSLLLRLSAPIRLRRK